MNMKINENDQGLIEVQLTGSLDTSGVEAIESQFMSRVAGLDRPVLVDLSGVPFVMSRGMTLLTRACTAARRRGQRLALLSPTPLVEEALHHAALDRLIPIAHSRSEVPDVIAQ